VLEAGYILDRQLLAPLPQAIAVVDDVLTTGAHFVAVSNILRREFPSTSIVGLFIARRVPQAANFEDFFSVPPGS
jgi:predicted amidophosphoribosyltransferase